VHFQDELAHLPGIKGTHFEDDVGNAADACENEKEHARSEKGLFLGLFTILEKKNEDEQNTSEKNQRNEKLKQRPFKENEDKKNNDTEVYGPEADVFEHPRKPHSVVTDEFKHDAHGDEGYGKGKSQKKSVQGKLFHGNPVSVALVEHDGNGDEKAHGKAKEGGLVKFPGNGDPGFEKIHGKKGEHPDAFGLHKKGQKKGAYHGGGINLKKSAEGKAKAEPQKEGDFRSCGQSSSGVKQDKGAAAAEIEKKDVQAFKIVGQKCLGYKKMKKTKGHGQHHEESDAAFVGGCHGFPRL
jgi:hypothetical protein